MMKRTVAPLAAICILVCLGAAHAAPKGKAASPTVPGLAFASDPCAARPHPTPEASDYAGGLVAKVGALTPATVKGATTVSPDEAACLMKRERRLVVVSAMDEDTAIPGSTPLPEAGYGGTFEDANQIKLIKAMAVLTAGDTSRPILVYCHHTQCYLSYNAALRLANADYSRVYWMREGIEGWKAAGYPIGWVKGGEARAEQREVDRKLKTAQAAAAKARAEQLKAIAFEVEVADIRSAVATSRAYRSFSAKCGEMPGYPDMSSSDAYQRWRGGRQEFGQCVIDFGEDIHSRREALEEADETITQAAAELDRLAPKRCSILGGDICVKDDDWSLRSELASAGARAAVHRAREQAVDDDDNFRDVVRKTAAAYARYDEAARRRNEDVDARNASRAAARAFQPQPSYSPPSYGAPSAGYPVSSSVLQGIK